MAVIYGFIIVWLAAAVLALINLGLIINTGMSKSFRNTHFLIYAVYGFPVLALFTGWFNSSALLCIATAFGVPVLVIGHFVSLLNLRRKLRSKQPGKIEKDT
jgi:hypothetical protein